EWCAPHRQGRQLFRSLAEWAESDIGRFHQRLSVVLFGASSVVCAAGLWRWGGRPGTGLLLAALAASALCAIATRAGRWPAR
ncbi:MAG TPA: hypothetical protein VFA81_11740, partial [Burkholderiales bacterium]|nr:hypothetical protein [Burkholderiales bacterium]